MRFKNNFIQIKTVSIQLWRLNIFTPAHFCQRCRALILWQLIFIRETIIPIVRIKNKVMLYNNIKNRYNGSINKKFHFRIQRHTH